MMLQQYLKHKGSVCLFLRVLLKFEKGAQSTDVTFVSSLPWGAEAPPSHRVTRSAVFTVTHLGAGLAVPSLLTHWADERRCLKTRYVQMLLFLHPFIVRINSCDWPLWHWVPWYPGGQMHWPDAGWQEAPFLQSHCSWHRGPWKPGGQADGKDTQKFKMSLINY